MRLDFCVACRDREPAQLEHHHFVPLSRGGSDVETNLITLCRVCHRRAHDMKRAKTIANREEARQRAKALAPIFNELAGKSAREVARTLNDRKVATPTGKLWSVMTVIRVRERLAAGGIGRPSVRYTELSPDRFKDFWR